MHGRQSEDGHLCGIPPTPRLGTVIRETPYRTLDSCQEAYFPPLTTW